MVGIWKAMLQLMVFGRRYVVYIRHCCLYRLGSMIPRVGWLMRAERPWMGLDIAFA
jgi:hypothetical protein